MRIDPWEWARWTLKDFNTAYEGWARINVYDPWERTRALSFYVIASQGAKVDKWQDVFALDSDKTKGKKKLKPNAIIRPQTEQEKREFEQIKNGSR